MSEQVTPGGDGRIARRRTPVAGAPRPGEMAAPPGRRAELSRSSDVFGLRPQTRGYSGPRPGRSSYPADLAAEVWQRLQEEAADPPRVEVLVSLFEALWFASLRTEENHPVHCTITFLDPNLASAWTGSGSTTPDRWSATRFSAPRALTAAELVKLSRAADPAASSLAVHPQADGQLVIWGMVDQMVDFQTDDQGFAGDGPTERPGLFQAAVAPAQLTVYRRDRLVASLVHGQLSYRFHDVLHRGRIQRLLEQPVQRFVAAVRAEVGPRAFDEQPREPDLRRLWIGTLSRLLLGVQSYGHGGAILLVERNSPAGLNVKYELPYDRLLGAMRRLAVTRIRQAAARDRLWRGYLLKDDREDLPVDLHLEEGLSVTAQAACLNEIGGCVRFVASLSRVDGCVVLDRELSLGGFGVEITVQDEPATVFRAGDADGSAHMLRPVAYDHFGTRHRSVMRYCWRYPGSVGFVVSQDGTARALTRVEDRLLLWESIHLAPS